MSFRRVIHGASILSAAARTKPICFRSRVLTPNLPHLFIRTTTNIGDTGDNKSGHITTAPTEGIIFFTNILPPNLQWIFRLTGFMDMKPTLLKDQRTLDAVGVVHPQEVFTEAVRHDAAGNAEVVEILPRVREGGAFLKFKFQEPLDAVAIADAVRKHLEHKRVRVWWNPLSSVKADLVRGKPWVEDLSRLPSRRVRVEFLPAGTGGEPAAELSQEQLYSFFRPFGKLADIVTQPSDSKVVPRYAYLDFTQLRKAIMAKNCLHGLIVTKEQGGGSAGTILRLTYEKKARFQWISDWIFSHPRIVIPLVAALVASITVAIFDPLRTLSIKAHVTRSFHVEDNLVFQWFRRQSEDLINKVKQFQLGNDAAERGMQVVWDDRKAEIDQIQTWLMETADTFIIVQGPRGSGKKELVIDHALKHKREAHRVLLIDCKPVQEARGDAATIAAAAAQVGYRPVFSWLNNISGLMDLAAQGMTGVKAGFSETLENQLVKIWSNTATALKSIALENRKHDPKDAKMGDDEYLEAHPEHRPIVVIDNFLHKSNEVGASMVYDKVAEWAARLTTSNIAHVIFLTNDVSFSKALSKALPDRVFRQISLGDCSPEVAKQYVINHLDFDAKTSKELIKAVDGNDTKVLTPSQKRADLRELDTALPQLGGRLQDLEFLARRIKAGESPSAAVQEIIDQSASEILKMFLLAGATTTAPSQPSETRDWTPAQAWTLVRSLAAHDTLRYNEVLLADAFKGAGDRALAALESAELIAVHSENGRPRSVRPGKPVYKPAFRQLVDDPVLRAKMDLALLGDALAAENKNVEKFEAELKLLAELPRQPKELTDRIKWLLTKIAASQAKVEDFERESGDLKKVLQTEY